MTRSDRNAEWERLLAEPVSAVAAVKFSDGAAGVRRSASAVLTTSRFLLVKKRKLVPFPRTGIIPGKQIHLQIPRINITGLLPVQGRNGSFTLLWFDETEKRLIFRTDRSSTDLLEKIKIDILAS